MIVVVALGATLLPLALLFPVLVAAEQRPATPRVESAPAAPAPPAGVRRFMVVRTFAPGALDGLDASAKQEIGAKNARHDVTWVFSFANSDRTKTFCVYDGPSENAVRKAAQANGIPVEAIIEVPVVLLPK
jgi:hypothetical protein